MAAPLQVLVTGAAGRTGQIVLQKLLERPTEFKARGLVRSSGSANKVQSATGAPPEAVFIADIAKSSQAELDRAFEGVDAVVIATSAVPQIVYFSLVQVFWNKLWGKQARPQFTFKENQTPEQVDYEGQKKQIDAAKKAGVKHVVVVGSMGGTQKDNFLNTIGNGNILVWKRRAEEYLMGSGLQYTIIHPGGLIDKPGGERELVFGVDDQLIAQGAKNRSIPRADVAELCLQALIVPAAKNRAIDVVSKPPGEGEPTKDFAQLFGSLKGDCNYSINKPEPVTAAA